MHWAVSQKENSITAAEGNAPPGHDPLPFAGLR